MAGLTDDLLAVLVAAGAAERELSITGGADSKGNVICRPSPELRGHWVSVLNNGSPEFEIALALASIHSTPHADPNRTPLPIRANLEPVKPLGGDRWGWDDKAPSVVWTAGGLAVNLNRILSRRLLEEGGKRNLAFHHGVRLSTVAKFIERRVDDTRIADLLWALTLVDTQRAPRLEYAPEGEDALLPPRAYALLKPLFLPWALDFSREQQKWRYGGSGDDDPIKLEPRILPLLRAGRASEACRIAERRLLVSGVPPLRGAGELGAAVDSDRLAAALLLPVRNQDLDRMLSLVAHSPVMELQGA